MWHRGSGSHPRARGPLVAVLLAAGGCVTDEPLGGATAEIAGGTLETGMPEVVIVYDREVGGLCTGTVIGSRVVLTAKHCVQKPDATEPSAPRSFLVGVGSSLRGLTESLSVSAVSTTPGVYTDGRFGLDGALIGQDVAVLTLAAPTDIAPRALRRTAPSDVEDQEVTVVGFGETPAGDVGRKYKTTATVRRYRDQQIQIGSSICQGDSGGPMIQSSGEIIGVASYGTGSCGSGSNVYNSIFEFLALLDAAVEASGSCAPNGEELCDGIDNDCDDEIDEGCAALGESCSGDDECVTERCAELVPGEGGVCTLACDLSRPELICPAGYHCAGLGGCEGLCRPGSPADGELGAPCEDAADCASLHCDATDGGAGRCREACRVDAGSCLAREVCVARDGACGACVPLAEVPEGSPRGLGEPCADDDQCASALCLADGAARFCTRTCAEDADCGDVNRFHCRGTECVPGRREPAGGPCQTNDDCTLDTVCATRGTTRWCGAFCSGSDDCAEGFDCVDAADARLCAPVLGMLGEPCGAPGDCVSGRCGDGDVCVRQCSEENPCPAGFACMRDEDGAALCERVRAPTADEGCAVGAAPRGRARPLAALVLLVLWTLARRRRGAREDVR